MAAKRKTKRQTRPQKLLALAKTQRQFVIAGLVLLVAGYMVLHTDRFKNMENLPNPPLKLLAERRGIQMGAYVSPGHLADRPYQQMLNTEFEHLIIDGESNWGFVGRKLRPEPDKYDFRNIDRLMDYAEKHGLSVRIQHLVWGEPAWLPDWLKNGNYANDRLLELLEDHIHTVGTRYEGKVREWSVVNEAFSRKLARNGLNDWWGDRLGTEYIDKSFKWAKAADPNAVLILNDFDNETINPVSDLMYEYARGAIGRGVPIDAIGMQMHLNAKNPPKKDDMVASMKRFGSLRLKIYITEFDINMHDVRLSDEEEDELQAQIYHDVVAACVEAGPNVCVNIGLNGLTDKQSWYRGIGIGDADPYAFDKDYKPKPAYYRIRDALEGR